MAELEAHNLIRVIRHQKVILDADLATIYGVSTKRLNQQVQRNRDRFPADFMFQLSEIEEENLRLQNATSSSDYGGRRYLPYAFTEHGAVMLASVLKTPVAIEASIQVVRAFIQLRQLANSHVDLARKIDQLEKKYDRNFVAVFDAIRKLMEPSAVPAKKKIGIHDEG